MSSLQIDGGDVLFAGVVGPQSVVMESGKIASIGSVSTRRYPSIDATDLIVAPGFIDLQVNGGFGIDLLEEPEGVWRLGERLTSHGVTAYLPTVITSSPDRNRAMLEALSNRPDAYSGAEPLGAHFEGPMLNVERAGAHPSDRIRPPSLAIIDDWSRINGVALVTLAPELDGALQVISSLCDRGVVVAAGHSNATSTEALEGFGAGVSMVTHLFNAMAPLGHREPNLVGAALAEDTMTVGLIVDGVHVDPLLVATTWKAKGQKNLALVTDAVAAMGQPPGRYRLGRHVVVSDGAAVRLSDGTLAGSLLTMNQAVRNLCSFTSCEVAEALGAASTTPARTIAAHDRGEIRVGAIADVTLLDHNFDVHLTICRGRVAFASESGRERLSPDLIASAE